MITLLNVLSPVRSTRREETRGGGGRLEYSASPAATPGGEAVTPAYLVTDAYFVTTAAHSERPVMSGYTNSICSLADNCVERPDLRGR